MVRIRSQLRKRRKEELLPMEVKRRRREKKQLEKVKVKAKVEKAPRRKRKRRIKRRRVVLLDSKTTQRFVFLGTGQLKASGSKMPSTLFPCLSSTLTETSLSARFRNIIWTTTIIESEARN